MSRKGSCYRKKFNALVRTSTVHILRNGSSKATGRDGLTNPLYLTKPMGHADRPRLPMNRLFQHRRGKSICDDTRGDHMSIQKEQANEMSKQTISCVLGCFCYAQLPHMGVNHCLHPPSVLKISFIYISTQANKVHDISDCHCRWMPEMSILHNLIRKRSTTDGVLMSSRLL
jgi:hypothetical protein